MKLQTKLPPISEKLELNYSSHFLLNGSCFAENIGKRLEEAKFSSMVNPLGISFNPLSLFNLIQRSINREFFDLTDFQLADEKYFSFDLHSSFSSLNQEEAIRLANLRLEEQALYLQKANCIIFSLGTAWVHLKKDEQQLVNNCHQLPATEFEKTLLSIGEITDAWRELLKAFKKQGIKSQIIIFTVSPVRHLKDGFHENQLSKSTLLLAVDQICEEFDNCHYFPSYEIMMDELRDYRFYDRDLIHPNETAIDIIWEYFQNAFCSDSCRLDIQKVGEILAALHHKPFHAKSSSHIHFLEKLKEKIMSFQKTSQIQFDKELLMIENQLKA